MVESTTEKPRPDIEEIVEELKSYVNISMDLYKMKTTEKAAGIASTVIIHVVVGVFVSLVFLFASLALAFIFAEYFGKIYLGFLIVAGIYSVIATFIFLTKDKWLKEKLINNFIKAIYSH